MSNLLRMGITVGEKHSYSDYALFLKSRTIGLPKKRVIMESVPYANGAYDFSSIAGEPTYDNRTVNYTFDIVGDDVEDMEELKTAVLEWLLPVTNAEIRDDGRPGMHLIGSCVSADWSEDDVYGGELGVEFSCYPFWIADTPYTKTLASSGTIHNGGRPVLPTITTGGAVTVTIGGIQKHYDAAVTDEPLGITLQSGDTAYTRGGSSATIKWREERM